MENRCIQDTKLCSKIYFFGKRGVFPGREEFEGREKRQKEKRPIFRTLLLFFVVYDVLYSISTGLIPERIQLRF